MSYQPEAARSAADRFIRLHPQHPNVDYAYYIKGLAEFNKDRGLLDRFSATDISKRDPTSSKQAFDDFSDFLQRHPDSEYAADARQRMVFLVNILAKYEINVAKFYMRRGALRRCESARRRRAPCRNRSTTHWRFSSKQTGGLAFQKPLTTPCGFLPSTTRTIPRSMIKVISCSASRRSIATARGST